MQNNQQPIFIFNEGFVWKTINCREERRAGRKRKEEPEEREERRAGRKGKEEPEEREERRAGRKRRRKSRKKEILFARH